MTIYRILLLFCFLQSFLLNALDTMRPDGGKEHYLGLKLIIQPPETQEVKPPGYRGRLIWANQVRDTFQFTNTGTEIMYITKIVSEESSLFTYTKTVAPGATGYIYYKKEFYPDGKGLANFDIRFSIQTARELYTGFRINYLVLHPYGLNIYFPKTKSNKGYRIIYNNNLNSKELRVELDSNSNLIEYGYYHTGFNQKIGIWRRYSNNKLISSSNHYKCFPAIVYKANFQPCLNFQVKVLLDNGVWKPALLYAKDNRVDLIVDHHVQRILIEQGDSSELRKIDYKKMPEWRDYATVFELKTDADRYRIGKIGEGNLNPIQDDYVLLLDQPYWRKQFTDEAIEKYNLNVRNNSIGQIAFTDKSISDRFVKKVNEDWKVSAITQSYDSSLYLKDFVYFINVDSSQMYALDTMMMHNGFERRYGMPYGYMVYKHVGKLLDQSYYQKFLRLQGRMMDLEMYILSGQLATLTEKKD